MAFANCKQHLEIFSEILVLPVKLQLVVSRASLIFQKRYPDAVSRYGRLHITSTSCTRSNTATAKQNKITSKIRNQRTNGPVNAHLIAWPTKAQNIQNLEIYGKEMTLTFNTHKPS